MDLKKLVCKRTVVWAATSAFLAAFLIVANVLARTEFRNLLNSTIGGPQPILAKEDDGSSLHFEQEFFTKKDARENGDAVTQKLCEEGMILLKNENNALPLKANAKVSVFGRNSIDIVRGGSGSANPGSDDVAKASLRSLFDSLKAAGIDYNPELEKFYNSSAAGSGRSSNPDMEHGDIGTLKTGETPIDKYPQSVIDSYANYGDAALVVFSRIAGENWDLPRVADDNKDRHYLELDNNERALLKHIVDSGKFQHIVILLNGSNYIDLGFLKNTADPAYSDKIDACINIGSPGGSGIMALGRILSGKVNPSGHTVDTVYTNYENDPTWQNFGGNFEKNGDAYLKGDGSATGYYTVEYEENIYLGYRYYETRGYTDGEEWYNKNVVYPFGYGLSYTTFEQTIANADDLNNKELKADTRFDVSVEVKNTGDVAGKQVVQLYATAPYTNKGIEKAYKVLVGFAKTKELKPGETDTVKITVDPYDFASFDSQDMNKNGFKGYELEAGDYVFHAGTDAHTDFATFTMNLPTAAKFEKDPVTGAKVEPLFEDVTDSLFESLSRSDFAGTFPETITKDEREVTPDFLELLKSYETTNDEVYDKLPTMGAEVTMMFKELAGKEYDDPAWETFLDQLTFDEMVDLFNEGCYSTGAIARLGVPITTSADGPTGLVSFLGNVLPGMKPDVYGCCYYCSECIVAQTYNLELAKEEAYAIGNESLVGNERGSKLSYPGWYSPAVNLHRSPFSGRNTEYYSEDPFLAGKMAAMVIKSVQEKGVYANVKHFALNDQETNRSNKGIATWCDEQAMRELYFKPFEFAVKEGKSRGLMSSFNRIGTEWAGGSYRLLTTVLRDEWGFVGSVICDFHTDSYMDSKQMLYAGGDLNLVSMKSQFLPKSGANSVSSKDAKDCNLLRRSSHRLLYCIANSNAMKADIIGYDPAIWEIGLVIATVVIACGCVAWGVFAVLKTIKKNKEIAE